MCVAGCNLGGEVRSALEEARKLRSNLTIDEDDEDDDDSDSISYSDPYIG